MFPDPGAKNFLDIRLVPGKQGITGFLGSLAQCVHQYPDLIQIILIASRKGFHRFGHHGLIVFPVGSDFLFEVMAFRGRLPGKALLNTFAGFIQFPVLLHIEILQPYVFHNGLPGLVLQLRSFALRQLPFQILDPPFRICQLLKRIFLFLFHAVQFVPHG